MKKVKIISGVVAPLDRVNVDTDAIIPQKFMKSTIRTGFGHNLFDAWRYLDIGEPGQDVGERIPNPEFALNRPEYAGANILLARQNFGCGSSREHAPWALLEYGFEAVIASGFGDIFRNNALKNGLLTIVLAEAEIDEMFNAVNSASGYLATIDLAGQSISTSTGQHYRFEIDMFRKRCLEQGVDEIALALLHADAIKKYEQRASLAQPWLFDASLSKGAHIPAALPLLD